MSYCAPSVAAFRAQGEIDSSTLNNLERLQNELATIATSLKARSKIKRDSNSRRTTRRRVFRDQIRQLRETLKRQHESASDSSG